MTVMIIFGIIDAVFIYAACRVASESDRRGGIE